MSENSIVVLLSNCDQLSTSVSACSNDSFHVGVKDRIRDCHGYGFTRGVSETGDAGTGTVTKFRHRA